MFGLQNETNLHFLQWLWVFGDTIFVKKEKMDGTDDVLKSIFCRVAY